MNQKLFPEQTEIPAIRIADTMQNQNPGEGAVRYNVTDEWANSGVNLKKILPRNFMLQICDDSPRFNQFRCWDVVLYEILSCKWIRMFFLFNCRGGVWAVIVSGPDDRGSGQGVDFFLNRSQQLL